MNREESGVVMTKTAIEKMQQVLATADKIALSTAINNQANVKLVNFVWFKDEPDRLYFSSVKGTTGLETYQQADCALITIPADGTPNNPYLRAQHVTITATAKSMRTDLLPRYLETVAHYQAVWDQIGSTLVPYEIQLHDVLVDPGLGSQRFHLNF